MPEMTAAEIAKAINARVENAKYNGSGVSFSHFHFDTRLIEHPGTLFFAFKSRESDNDGHDYLHKLAGKPGLGAVVRKDFDASAITGLDIPLLRVDDPMEAAQQLARYVRNTLRHIKYIGVTGSAGKTTTKEFIYQLLSYKYKTGRSYKNWNNWIGVPFSILNMKGDEDAAVFELAMSDPGIGEIDLLAEILRPDVAVILNVFPVHLEFLHTVENAAIAKSEILNYIGSHDAAFLNACNEPLMNRINKPDIPKGRKVYFSAPALGQCKEHVPADIRFTRISREGRQTRMAVDFYGNPTHFVTPLVNRIHLENLFVAIVVVHHMGMKQFEIQEALAGITPLAGRGSIYVHQSDNQSFTIVDETYNSNPEAVKRALEWVDMEYSGPKIAILGDMLELGDREKEYHNDVGRVAAALGYQRLLTVGQRARHIADGALQAGMPEDNVQRFDSAKEAGTFLKSIAETNPVLLFKASRGIGLEAAIEEFKNG